MDRDRRSADRAHAIDAVTPRKRKAPLTLPELGATPMTEPPHLFLPIVMRSLHLQNRIVVSRMRFPLEGLRAARVDDR